jgi:hypothetical protein
MERTSLETAISTPVPDPTQEGKKFVKRWKFSELRDVSDQLSGPTGREARPYVDYIEHALSATSGEACCRYNE